MTGQPMQGKATGLPKVYLKLKLEQWGSVKTTVKWRILYQGDTAESDGKS